jgi:hypothetical protein
VIRWGPDRARQVQWSEGYAHVGSMEPRGSSEWGASSAGGRVPDTGRASGGGGGGVGGGQQQGRTIFVSNFPQSGAWGDVGLTAVVVASAIHRTYNVRTSPSMVAFHDNGQWATVDLVSHADARQVASLAEQGIMPILHHRDRSVPSHSLAVCRGGPAMVPVEAATAQGAAGMTVIQVSNLPGIHDQQWSGVRMTETAIASMIHRTYNVRTHPRDVVSIKASAFSQAVG